MPTRTIIASGLWSDSSIWEDNIPPTDGDSVVHPSPHVVVLDIHPPTLDTYTLNGVLLFRAIDTAKFLRIATLTGTGGIDIEETTQQVLKPFGIIGNATLPADLTSLSSFFSYYALYFHDTQHYEWWMEDDISGFDPTNPTSKFFPKVSSVSREGNDVLITVSAPEGSAAAHFLQENLGSPTPFLIPVKHPSFPTQATILTPPTNLTIQSSTTLVYPNAPEGFEDDVVVGAHVIITRHTSLCPLVLQNVILPATRIVGASIESDCKVYNVYDTSFIFCFVGGGLDASILRGAKVCFVGREDTTTVLDIEHLVWCAYTPTQ